MAMALSNPYTSLYRGTFSETEQLRHGAASDGKTNREPMLPAGSPLSYGAPMNTIGLTSPITHFEENVLVHVRQLDREEVLQPLGVAVISGLIGTARCVSVRVTDPRDPFFLYSMTLSENDYGRFKETHELHVDWNGFPQNLIAMFSGVVNLRDADGHPPSAGDRSMNASASPVPGGQTPVSLHFLAQHDGRGTLRVMERTGFRSLEHLSLSLTQQGDVGQKQYLAERFKYYEAEFHSSDAARAHERAEAQKRISDLCSDVSRLDVELTGLQQRLKQDLHVSEAKHASEIAALKDDHLKEIRKLYAELESERVKAKHEVARAADESHAALEALRAELDLTSKKYHDSETAREELVRRHAEMAQRLTAVTEERNRLDEEVTSLQTFKTQAVRDKTQWELREATLTERLRHFELTCADRTQELNSLRTQHEEQAHYASHLKDQLEQATTKLSATDTQMGKVRQVYNQQQQALNAAKEKIALLQTQLQAAEALANERALSVERAKQEASLLSDKLDIAQSKIAELKNSLEAAEDAKTKLTHQLKQNEDALLHVQRMGTVGGGGGLRSWSSISPLNPLPVTSSSGIAARVSYSPSSGQPHGTTLGTTTTSGLFRDFAKGASTAQVIPSATARQQVPNTSRNFPAEQAAVPSNGTPRALGQTSDVNATSAVGVFADSTVNSSFHHPESKAYQEGNSRMAPGKAPPPTSAYFPSLSS